MATLVSAHNLTKTFGARPLFDGITFMIDSGSRVGLIGPNGAGKSTLLKILAGKASPDGGTLSTSKGLRVGYLEQDPAFADDSTILSAVLEGAASDEHHHEWEGLATAQENIAKLSLNTGGLDEETRVDTLSGGWRKRVALARELARKPELLLLDEPTNHLDVESIVWLEELIARAPFAVLTVTHDRLFLQRIATRILELDRRNAGGLLSVDGDYATYLDTKDRLMAAQERREIILKNTLRRETEWLRRGAKARTTKQQARITRAGDLKEEVSELSTRNQNRIARLDFVGVGRNPKRLIEAKAISKSLGGKLLFKGLDLMITPGTRVGLLGANGCGKSTLIRVLLGHEAPDAGTVERADGLSVAYFEQNRDTLDPEMRLCDTLCPRGDFVEYRGGRVHIRSYLDRFLFTAEQATMPVGRLSGGEQSRVLIARLMLQPANVLVLDEPTNDLDLATLTVLEECLTQFDGAVLLVTHDRYFLDQVATKILAFPEAGEPRLVAFADLEQWEDWQAAQRLMRAPTRASSQKGASPEGAKKRKLSYNEQRELDAMEANISHAEETLARLSAESALPENASNASHLNEIAKGMAEAQHKIDRLYARWSELTGH